MSARAMFESLETRQLLSAAVHAVHSVSHEIHAHSSDFVSLNKHGKLLVTGSGHADKISLSTSGKKLVVNVDGRKVSFSQTKVHSFEVDGGSGNDQITVASNVSTTGTLDGGAGNDTLTAGGGTETLIGGAGNDTLIGNANGHCTEEGGAGDDTLTAGNDGDAIDGGTGDDQIKLPEHHDHGHHGNRVLTIDQLPAAVQAGLLADANGATITHIFLWHEHGTPVYAALTTTPGLFLEVDMAGNTLPVGLGGDHHTDDSSDTGDSNGDTTIGDTSTGDTSTGDNSTSDQTGEHTGDPVA